MNRIALPPGLCLRFIKGLSFILVSVLLTGCKQKETADAETVSDTAAVAVPEADVSADDEHDYTETETENPASLWPRDVVSYSAAENNDVRKNLENFSMLAPVLEAAARSVAVKDSLEIAHADPEGGYPSELKDPADSAIFRPFEIQAWQLMQEYKKKMAAATPVKDRCPSLLDLTRNTDAEDKSAEYLPKVSSSRYLSHGKFFFLGGAPFIQEIRREDGTPFTDAQGKPEKHFSSNLTENGNYFLNSVYHFRNVRINVTFGEALRSYDMGPQEVNGVGTLIHEFVDVIHVFFLTENGVVPATLISTEVKLMSEGLGCVPDQPNYIFACGKNINANEILAIYVPYHSEPVTEFKLTRVSNGVWTADVNEDGVADLACVSGSYEGISSDYMAEVLWFVNINGTWQIIDYANDLDCT